MGHESGRYAAVEVATDPLPGIFSRGEAYMKTRDLINLFRRYPYWNREKCIFIHIPKAAGTSINHALYGRTLGHFTYEEINQYFPQLVRKSFVFSVARNPYDRLVSAYHFAKQGGTAQMGMHRPQRYLIPEFHTFASFVSDWLQHQDLKRVDHVFRPQYLYVCHKENVAVNFLGKVESIQEDICTISQRLQRPLTVGKHNVVKRQSSYRDFYTPELASLVYRLYEFDFQKLGYRKEIIPHFGGICDK